ncbi:MAG: acetylxylan esterase [Phycisphaerae bacterium]|nr:acetylxylan esterase [Phycisphaerae bacterium]
MTRAVAEVLLVMLAGASAKEDLTVLPDRLNGVVPGRMMEAYLHRLAHAALDRRDASYEQLHTPDDLAAHAQRMRAFLLEQLDLPERTPLNAKVVGRVDGHGHRIEKILFESQPRHFVTGLLYLPPGDGPHPAVLVLCGHTAIGKGKEGYHDLCALLAANGLAAMCFDPIGQGERHQILSPDGTPRFYPSFEHMLMGVGSILLGRNTATYYIWDGIRAIDYLCARSDVDPKRIGCTGGSGGGTQTAYLMALDERVRCAAPRNYMTSLRRLIETEGPQDAEQNIHRQLAAGMAHGDFILTFAPRPVIILATTKDFFDIRGAWETFREAKRAYTRLGVPERVDLIEGDAGHGGTPEMYAGLVRWMRRWLMKVDSAEITEHRGHGVPPDALRCTAQGQTLLIEGARSVYDLNMQLEQRLKQHRQSSWKSAPPEGLLAKVRQIAGIRLPADLPATRHQACGRVQRPGYHIDKLTIEPEEGIVLSALLFIPKDASGDAYLYVHGEGKHVDACPGGRIEKLALAGHVVLAVDLRGIGETARTECEDRYDDVFGLDWKEWFLAYMLGRSYVGMRAEDVLASARFLGSHDGGPPSKRVHLVAIGQVVPPALHAAAVAPDLFASVTLEKGLTSWSDLVGSPLARNQLVNAVHGALRSYDLTDLAATLPAGKIRLVVPAEPISQ